MSQKKRFSKTVTFAMLFILIIFIMGCSKTVDEKTAEPDSQEESTWTKEDLTKLKNQPTQEPQPEICNNIDDDLDEEIDEDITQECGSSTIGICKKGIEYCEKGFWSNCENNIEPTNEICGNNLDDDCDGETDEDCLCITFFHNNYTPSGLFEKDFLKKLKNNKFPNLEIKEYIVTQNENQDVLTAHKQKHNVNFELLPLTFIGDNHIRGYATEQTTGKEILDLLLACTDCNCD
ncbi:hypothetical protein HOK51_00120 [Candidatus Woesearchaeota archaeon]|jgi:hypothetical protein|nr:hypothetical protein [Candidatus Woesearchaeota archaeon]MBT6518217.1 hypothetical protein [Candidatus Woesearchaeota archaeon]MBT7368514.1 hypothetical protein [Candidatus Woesearchaeota archaeon]